jgi:hypothetical protein
MTTPSIGAIRWDAWFSTIAGGPASQNAVALGDADLQPFAPVHYRQVNSYTLSPVLGTQAIIDNEITKAAANGLGYWAYLMYGRNPGDPGYANAPGMMNGWDLHQSSSIKGMMPWCAMMQLALMGSTGNYTTQVNQMVAYFQQSNYFMVLGNRPLMYIWWGSSANDLVTYWGGSLANVAPMIAALRTATTTAGLGTPYIVLMNGLDTTVKATLGADAIGVYNPGVTLTPNMTYADYETTVEGYWASQLATGSKFIPSCSAGYTRTGFYRRPVQFYQQVRPNIGGMATVARPTAAELKAHIAAARAFIVANPAPCDANTALLYAWNECSEGNGICPTIGNPNGMALS